MIVKKIRCLYKKNISTIVAACCTLHNICEIHGEESGSMQVILHWNNHVLQIQWIVVRAIAQENILLNILIEKLFY